YVVELDDKLCLLVVNTVHGSVQFTADSGDADANVPSLNDVDSCLMATGKDVDHLSAWLVPAPRLLEHIKKEHEKWLAEKPEHSRNNRMRTVKPLDVHFADCKFDLQQAQKVSANTITPEQARRGLAAHFDVDPSKIRISVDV
ncbi:MAG: hypothetical protein WBC85_01800, partial [Planktotalea sp.]|uniref:hypothetical protein n=1 Tax=Planktotalea sp. TaxID=2029877 RepID=UPI003C755CE3